MGVVNRADPGKVLVGRAGGTVGTAVPGAVENAARYQWVWNRQ
ncbi:hypothetical protein [Streptomyces griseomycini]|uniref:Uncharacterized protein n=1 Tax=Streptomyces griseomycini TaxID=66895 RepID=A0A7W7LZR7_9ACTN|nr:hypothetical protein [Streptomyces griseomycini]MBB4899322.1 hypothetical protein [Streptomyces griseomycini]GGQ27932.1 hypothetical protein GCM10010266_59000 [Streptomyces griseomycini]GGR35539.1 hypothetical protein GCM10015536_46540 [Streptomyces griseomycini]